MSRKYSRLSGYPRLPVGWTTAIKRAVRAVDGGASIVATAEKYGVNRSTLRQRVVEFRAASTGTYPVTSGKSEVARWFERRARTAADTGHTGEFYPPWYPIYNTRPKPGRSACTHDARCHSCRRRFSSKVKYHGRNLCSTCHQREWQHDRKRARQ